MAGNQDLNEGEEDRHGSLMEKEFANGMSIREAIAHINRCLEAKAKDPTVNVEIPGFLWNGCEYNKIK